MKMKKGIFALFTLSILSACTPTTEDSGKYAAFADCLTNSGAIFYGTEWCPHCKAQKALFGDALAQVNYVDCDAERDLCTKANIESYPTWVFGDGSRQSGTQPLETLAKKTGCELPSEKTEKK